MNIQNLRKDDFYLPILQTLDELGGSGQIEEIDNRVIEITGMTAEDLEATYEKSGALMVPDKISWSRSYLRQGGLLKNEGRGLWVLTEEGRAKLKEGEQAVHAAVQEAMRLYRKNYHAAKSASKTKSPFAPDISEPPELDEHGDWADELLSKLQSIDPYAFERLCQRLLRKNGFTQVEVTGKSGDGGIDGKGVVRVNLVSFHVLFQCKRYQGSVSAGTVRDFRGAMQGRADKGLIITTGTFTPRRTARGDEGRRPSYRSDRRSGPVPAAEGQCAWCGREDGRERHPGSKLLRRTLTVGRDFPKTETPPGSPHTPPPT